MAETDTWRFRGRGLFGALVLAPVGVAALLSDPLIPPRSALSLACQSLGWLVFLAGAAFRLWATLYIGSRKRDVLVTDGPYSVSRNPLYVGSFCLALSAALFLCSVSLVAAVLAAAAVYARATVRAEEEFLRGRFGEAFDAYVTRTPRFWPKFSLFHSPEIIEVKPRDLRTEWARATRWALIPLLSQAVAVLARRIVVAPLVETALTPSTHLHFWFAADASSRAARFRPPAVTFPGIGHQRGQPLTSASNTHQRRRVRVRSRFLQNCSGIPK